MFKSIAEFLRRPLAAAVLFSFGAGLVPFATPFVPNAAAASDPELPGRTAVEDPAPRVEFEENRGQFDKDVRFLARTSGTNLFLTLDEAVYVMRLDCAESLRACGKTGEKDGFTAYAMRMKVVGAGEAAVVGESGTGHRTNYFKGSASVTDVPNFERVRAAGIYPGIDMVWHGLQGGATRYDFIVAPGADPDAIELRFDGADSVAVDSNGDLQIDTPAGKITQKRPVTFQEANGVRIDVPSGFRTVGTNLVKFEVGDYDRALPLTIDPTVTLNTMAFSTLIGSFGDDFANDIAVDSNGNSYVTGKTLSPTFPTTSGTFDTSANGLEDVFVTKLNASGSGLVFSTFIGGTFYDEGHGIAVDALGDVYVAGVASSGFPTTASAYDTTFNGGSDVFVAKLSGSGNSLTYSTYIGAAQLDLAQDLAIDDAGNAYVVVRTSDAIVDYPTTAGAFDTTFNGVDDVAVSKLSPNGTALLYSTFLGGSGIDVGRSIAVNSAGEAYVGGTTTDDVVDFPTTAGAYDTTVNGSTDYFVTRINSAGSNLVFSTVVGGTGIDNANAIAIDLAGNAYIGGIAAPGFPVTAGVFDTTNVGSSEMAVSKISSDGASLLYSTFIGGTQGETVNGLAVDRVGNLYVGGENFGGDYPTTANGVDTTFNGANDAVVSVLNSGATALIYSTYIGGGGNDFGSDIAADPAGNVYLTGRTSLSGASFPVSNEAYQPFNAGGSDAYVTKLGDFSIGGKVIDSTTGNPVSNVMIALSGQVSGSVLTGPDGRFGFLDTVPGEPHAVSASRPGYTMNPAIFNIASLANNRELIFVATVGSPTGGSGGTLRMNSVSYTKSENGASVSVTIDRTGQVQTTDPVTVDFTTVDGTAVGGQDFQPMSGVITFTALETSKTINIPLVNDSTLEPKESFTVAIANPTNNADIESGRGSTSVQILDEDLADGDLLISEFRERGRLGAKDEYVKIYNPNDFDVTVMASDGSAGLAIAQATGSDLLPVATIPNFVTIGAHGHYLLTNNDPLGGFSVIDYPTGRGTVTAVGDQVFSADIPDNASLALMKTSSSASFTAENVIDAVGFQGSAWSEGKTLPAIVSENSEMSFVRRFGAGAVIDSGNNRSDFMLVDNHATTFSAIDGSKVLAILGAPAPETSDSLRMLPPEVLQIAETGTEVYDPTPVPNGKQGTLTVYRTLTNNGPHPIASLRLRAADFPVLGSALSARFSSRPDFRLISSAGNGAGILGATLAGERLQPNGGGINSTLGIDAINPSNPLLPGQSVVVAISFTVMRYGRHPIVLTAEGL